VRRINNIASSNYKIIVIDDEADIIETLSVILKRNGYKVTGFTNPLDAIEKIKKERFDLLILDYLMQPMHGDKVVERIRQFNKELYILLLTGHKDIAPPLETLRTLEIQGYCEKSDNFDQILLLLESGIKSITQMYTIKQFKDGLNNILQAVPKIYQLQPIGNILEEILTQIMPLVNSENAFILIDDANTSNNISNQSIFKGIGKYNIEIGHFMNMLEPDVMEHMGYARTMKRVVIYKNVVILPLVNEYMGQAGIIYIECNNTNNKNDNEADNIKLLEIFSNQVASSLNNAFLHSMVNEKNEELNKTYEQLKERDIDTIEALRLVVDAKDIYTRGHSDRVSYFTVKIGESFGLSEKELEILRISGIFHDIGKIGITNDILLKADKLNKYEYEEIKKHPLKGAHILSAVSMFKDIVPVVKYHHERIDGKGYPEGIKGNAIPLLARILSVADAFDAMTTDRQYRKKLGLEEAKIQLLKGTGTQFDENVVNKFIELLDDFDSITKEVAATYESDTYKG
jgi:HD-GYP domain-containing protein (c-di-GMP phosphodiesterase class II)/CheY-like chemotaxis protein